MKMPFADGELMKTKCLGRRAGSRGAPLGGVDERGYKGLLMNPQVKYLRSASTIRSIFMLAAAFGVFVGILTEGLTGQASAGEQRLLYVAEPGIRNYLEYGGHGVLVYDIDHGHELLRRIQASGLDEKGEPLNIKGICASAVSKRFYVSTTRTLTCFDLVTEKILWEKAYDRGCDRIRGRRHTEGLNQRRDSSRGKKVWRPAPSRCRVRRPAMPRVLPAQHARRRIGAPVPVARVPAGAR